MSWQPYVTSLEQGKPQATYAAIIGHDTEPPCFWAQSINTDKLPLTIPEISHLIRAIKCEDQSLMATGVKIGKQAFTVLRLETNLLIMQGKGDNKNQCAVIALTAKTCIVGFNDQPEVKVASVREGVQTIQDYLIAAGY